MAEDHDRASQDHHHIPRTRSEPDDDREQSADDRDQAAGARDQLSEAHDRQAEDRDHKADVRDVYAESRDRFDATFNAGAASDRMGAWRDRQRGGSDRAHAAADREASWTDRATSAAERAFSSIDELTGAHRRDAGLAEVEREVARAKRTRKPLVVAFIDVDGLKATNDSLGHFAGDQLLRHVVGTIRAYLRSYDLIVRFGGDEFLCSLLDLDTAKAAERFLLINADLAANQHASVTVGLAELAAHDSLDDLIARADAALLEQRHQRPSART